MAKYVSGYTARFYDIYGDLEWERLEATPYGRLQATIHADFIERTAVSLERRMNTERGLVDSGSHINLVARRKR